MSNTKINTWTELTKSDLWLTADAAIRLLRSTLPYAILIERDPDHLLRAKILFCLRQVTFVPAGLVSVMAYDCHSFNLTDRLWDIKWHELCNTWSPAFLGLDDTFADSVSVRQHKLLVPYARRSEIDFSTTPMLLG